MPSTYLFFAGTLLLSLNLVRPYGLAISDWLFTGSLAMAIIETARVDRENFPCWTRNHFLWPAGLILFGAVISTARAIFINTAILEIFQQLYVITVFISLIWIMVRRDRMDVIILAFIWSGLFTASVAAVDYFAGTNFGPVLSGTPNLLLWGRYAGTLGHPNKFGYYVVLTSLLTLTRYVAPHLHLWRRAGWGLALLIQTLGIYLSGSVTAYLGFLLGGVAFFVACRSARIHLLRLALPLIPLWALITLSGIFLGYTPFEVNPDPTGLISASLDRVQVITARSRWDIYEEAVEQISRSPLIGVGYDQVSTSGIEFSYRELDGTVHNSLLQVWYVGGLFAFIGWLTIYISIGLTAIRTLRSSKRGRSLPVILGLAAVALSTLLMDQFQDTIYQREKWLAIGLLVSYAWQQRENTELHDHGNKKGKNENSRLATHDNLSSVSRLDGAPRLAAK
jgi:O-antigen ligase